MYNPISTRSQLTYLYRFLINYFNPPGAFFWVVLRALSVRVDLSRRLGKNVRRATVHFLVFSLLVVSGLFSGNAFAD